MTNYIAIFLTSVLVVAPAIAAPMNTMTDMDKNYIQLAQDGWEEIGNMSNGFIMMRKDTKRALCEISDVGRIYGKLVQKNDATPEYTLRCFEIKTQ